MSPILSRVFAMLAVTVGVAIGAAIVLAIADIYLAGHGHASLSRDLISWPAAGVSLSFADCAWYLAILVGAIIGWRRFRS